MTSCHCCDIKHSGIDWTFTVVQLTISIPQAHCAVATESGIPSDFVRKSTASIQIKISAAQLNFSNRNPDVF